MEKKTASPPRRKYIVMWTRLEWYGYKRHQVTITLVSNSGGLYTLFVSGRKLYTISNINVAQSWFLGRVRYFMDEHTARIIAGSVYYGGQ